MCRSRARIELFTVCLAGVLTLVGGLAARGDEDQLLDQFLGRLGLAELRLMHLERMLASESSSEKRLALARRVADAYAEELITAADETERFAALQSRVTELLASYPEARTPAGEVILLQAEYQRAEALLLRWLEEPGERTLRDQATQIFARIGPLLTARQAELAAAIERAADALDNIKLEQQRLAAEERLLRQRAVAARADYFAGWSAYYLGVARQNRAGARPDFTSAKEHFLRILDLPADQDLESVEADSLGLESIWRCRAAIGLGLAEFGLDHHAAATHALGWLRHAAAPPVIRDQAAYWQLQGLLNAGLASDAAHFATAQVAAFAAAASPGKTSLCITAIRAAAALPADQAAHRQQLLEGGLRGLARMRQFETLDKLIDKFKLDEAYPGEFQLAWLRGRREYLAAEKAKQADGYRAAAATLTAALALPQARASVSEAGQARYYLAWARYRLEEHSVAARHFHEAATALRTMIPDLAMQAAWMHATCLTQLAAKDKHQAAPAIAALQAFKQEYPESEDAQRAALLITRLRHSHSDPIQAIHELAAVQPAAPGYLDAQYEICQLRHQLWSKSKSDAAKARRLADELLTSVDRVLTLADRAGDGERRLKAALLAIDVLQATPEPDEARVGALLSAVRAAAEGLAAGDLAAAEFHYRLLQQAQRTGDQKRLSASAEWLARHGVGTPYELPALVVVARAADQAVASASPADRTARATEAAALYARLVRLFGESPPDLSTQKNALAAASKLAHYDELLERWPEAADRLGRLVVAAPHDRRLLRRAGLAHYNAGRFGEALGHWRNLLAGLESGNEDWLEAKYYQLSCLAKTDPASARQVLKQFRVLFPDVKSAAWRERLAELERQLTVRAHVAPVK